MKNLASVTFCLTHACNLSCSYCSVEAGASVQTEVMSLAVVEQTVNNLIRPSAHPKIGVVFFGGEPLLANIDWYEAALSLLHSADKEFQLGIQTNGVRINKDWIALFKRHDISVSISLDGPPAINEIYRQGSHKVLDAIALLKEHHVPCKIISLITPSSWNRMEEILAFFQKREMRQVRFNTCFDVGRGQNMKRLSGEQLAQARRAILDHMLTHGDEAVIDYNLYNQLNRYAHWLTRRQEIPRSGCTGFYCHGGRTYFAIAPDGGIYPCSDIVFTTPEARLGSVQAPLNEAGLPRFLEANRTFHKKHPEWWNGCSTCPAQVICEFGCPAFMKRGTDFINLECLPTRLLWQTMQNRQEDVLKWYTDRSHLTPLVQSS